MTNYNQYYNDSDNTDSRIDNYYYIWGVLLSLSLALLLLSIVLLAISAMSSIIINAISIIIIIIINISTISIHTKLNSAYD